MKKLRGEYPCFKRGEGISRGRRVRNSMSSHISPLGTQTADIFNSNPCVQN